MDDPAAPPRLPALVAAFAGIYLVWGSTYLGIQIALETLPPLLMAGLRFGAAGLFLFLWLRRGGAAAPTGEQWRAAALTGGLLLLFGNGLVTLGQQQKVPSGVAALMIATTPAWMVLAGWLLAGEPRPGPAVAAGIIIGFAGAALLIRPGSTSGGPDSVLPYLSLLAAPAFWSLGTICSRRAARPRSLLLFSSMQMLLGGAMMLVAGTLLGEWALFAERGVSLRSGLAFAYLTVFGSLVGFSVYTWLLRHASTAALSTYAYVNPLVAVLLGWSLGGETVGAELLLAATLIVGAVLLITLRRRPVSSRGTDCQSVPRAAADAPEPPRSVSLSPREL